MKEFLNESVFFGVAISVLTYEIGVLLKKKLKLDIINPLLVSIVAVILFLLAFRIPYEKYNEGAKYISYLLTPATVCLAIPLYEQVELLKKNVKAILAGLLSGVFTSVLVTHGLIEKSGTYSMHCVTWLSEVIASVG